MKPFEIDGNKKYSVEDIVQIARGQVLPQGGHTYPRIVLSEGAKDILRKSRAILEKEMAAGKIMYGVNTGVGKRKGIIIPLEEIIRYQRHYIHAHSVGVGEYYPEEVVRAAMILRVLSFVKGNSGITLELCEKIIELYNAGIIPLIPCQGSVGASGDLCPLSHLGSALIGIPDQTVLYKGREMSSIAALTEANITPLVLQAKEAMGLTNGATFILAVLTLGAYDTRSLIAHSNIAASLSLEAIRGEVNAYDERIHEARNHPGQVLIAQEVRTIIHGSARMTKTTQLVKLPDEEKHHYQDKPVPRVQDAYSFRCYPQVLGAVCDTLQYAWVVAENEINASTDNPLVFAPDDMHEECTILSGGNFHGMPLALAADFLKIAVQRIANISDRRFFALTMPSASYGLPADLAGPTHSDANTGLMIMQYMTAALVSENKVLCHPASADSIPTSADQEDDVSMGSISARYLRKVIENTFNVVGAEIIAACQGLSLTQENLGNPLLGVGTQAAYAAVREVIPMMDDDRFIRTDILKINSLMKSNRLVSAVDEAIGGMLVVK